MKKQAGTEEIINWNKIKEEMLYGIVDLMILFWFYRVSMFITIHHTTATFSKRVLFFCVLGIFIIRELIRIVALRKRVKLYAKGSIIIGAGVYTVLAYYEYYTKWFLMVLVIFAICSLGRCILILTQKVKGKRLSEIQDPMRREYMLRKRIRKSLGAVDSCFCIAIVLLMIPIGYNRYMNNGIMKAETLNIRETDGDAWEFFETNINVIEKIRENARWKPLPIGEKMCTLQAIADYAVKSLGIEKYVTVVLEDYETDEIQGEYSAEEHLIRISRKHVETSDADECLNTILHEVYHYYEYCLMNLYQSLPEQDQALYLFQNCRRYIEENRSYVNGTESYEEFIQYYDQQIEEDSRTYAEEMVTVCYKYIDGLQGNYESYGGEILD